MLGRFFHLQIQLCYDYCYYVICIAYILALVDTFIKRHLGDVVIGNFVINRLCSSIVSRLLFNKRKDISFKKTTGKKAYTNDGIRKLLFGENKNRSASSHNFV